MQSAAQKFMDDALEYDELYGKAEEQDATPRLTAVSRKRRILATVSRLRLLLCAGMLVAVVSLTIYNNVAMVELGDRLNNQTNTFAALRAEGERLQSKMDNAISLSEVGEKASTDMLMGKVESYQVSYISLGEEDTVQRSTKTPDQMPYQKVMNTIKKLQEYVRNR